MAEELNEIDILKSKVDVQQQLIRQDITLRIAEVCNSSGYLERALIFGDRDIGQVWPPFVEDFIKLFTMVKYYIDVKGRDDLEIFFKNLMLRRFAEQKLAEGTGILQSTDVEDEFKKKTKIDMQTYVNLLSETTPFKCLDKYEEFMKYLNEAGILDIMQFELLPHSLFSSKTPETPPPENPNV